MASANELLEGIAGEVDDGLLAFTHFKLFRRSIASLADAFGELAYKWLSEYAFQQLGQGTKGANILLTGLRP